MRTDPPDIATMREGQSQEWRYAIQIVFATSSPTITSRDGIANLPGTPIEGVVKSISSRSQQVWPDEGRTTIGQITVEILDIANALTVELRDQLHNDDAGIRDKELRVFAGVGDDFNTFTRVATAFVDSCTYDAGVYTIAARDRTRELRDKILDPKKARISAAVTETATSISVRSTAGFSMVAHGPSFADAPNTTVGYLRHKKTGEIMRYTGMTSTSFTGITRGVFRTRPAPIEFNAADPVERWPEVEEYIYLELPGPAMAIALMTGIVNVGTSPMPTLPAHWHLGMDWGAAFDQASWLNIGTDLWSQADYSIGFPLRLAGFTSDTDGKKLIESDVLRLLGLYAPTTAAGQISLRRVARITASQGYVAELNTDNVVSHGPLRYDLTAVRNKYQVRYNYDGEEFTRSMAVIDAGSIARNGESETSTLEFRSLTTERHTERLIKSRLEAMADRYAEPPLRLQVKATPNMTWLEIGDTVRVRLASIQNHVSVGSGTLDQTFEIQSTSINWTTGEVTLDLFASGRLIERAGSNELTTAPLADAWYTTSGTNITSLTGYVAGSPSRLTANVTLTGGTDINSAGSIWYHAGDLQIDAGVTVTIQNQAQLRVRGFLTCAGTIDGSARGYAGGTDPDTVTGTSTGWAKATGTAGYLGPTRPGAGMLEFYSDGADAEHYRQVDGAVIEGKARATAVPYLNLATDNAGALTSKLPADLRGTSGSPGGQVIQRMNDFTSALGTGGTVQLKGGAGGASGAGLAIICRGLGFSTAGIINLSGADGLAGQQGGTPDVYDTSKKIHWDFAQQAGAGAGGFPGALHILLDGDGVPYPDLNALTVDLSVGDTPIAGYSAIQADNNRFRQAGTTYEWPSLRWPTDMPTDGDTVSPRPSFTGMNPSAPISGNLWSAASMVQYIPATGAGTPDVVPAPTDLDLTVNTGSITASWLRNTAWDFVEVFASTTNDRAFAEEIGEAAASAFTHQLPNGGTRYYWIRAVRGAGAARQVSEFYPTSATGGVSATAMAGGVYTTVTASNGVIWNGDTSGSPVTWAPTGTTTDLTFTALQFGSTLAQEVVRVTLDPATGGLTWAYVTNDAGVTTTASSTPATTVTFTFVHTASGLTNIVTVAAIRGGGGAGGAPGADGLNNARVMIYKRSASAPTLPSASTTYTFATGGLTGLNNGWTIDVPSGTDPLYVSAATASSTTATDAIAPGEWAAAVIMAQDGADGGDGTDGINSATVFIYQRTATATAPALPGVALTYTFATGLLSGTLGSWTQTVPAAGGAYLHVSTATALNTAPTDSIAPGEWAVVRLLAQDGDDGATGPPGSRALTVRARRSDLTGTAVNNSMYVHGFDSNGNPAAVDGEIAANGITVSVPATVVVISQDTLEGWLIFETNAASSPFGGKRIGACRKTRSSSWVYDTGSAWATFTATATMVAIGNYAATSAVVSAATTLGNAITLHGVPYENAHLVEAGDLQAGAIDDVGAFATTLRPVVVVSSLPTLPDASYPNGATIYLTGTKKIYRADYARSPVAWIVSVDGADITAGTIQAAALAADIVLATLIRTAGSGNRVEMQGASHAFPFWIGSGTKGTVSGTPGSGAKVYYDAALNAFVVSGRITGSVIETSVIAPAVGGSVLMIQTNESPRLMAPIFCAVLDDYQYDSPGTTAKSTTYEAVPSASPIVTLYHPTRSTSGADAKRLQEPAQHFLFDFEMEIENLSASNTATMDYRAMYAIDSDASYTVIGGTTNTVTIRAGRSRIIQIRLLCKVDRVGWTSSVKLNVEFRKNTGSAADLQLIRWKSTVYIPNANYFTAGASNLS